MSIRTRLQSFIESKQKIQIWYGMGCHNVCTGRVLFVDQDHVDVESYVHDNDGQINIKRLLIPTHLILHIDITAAESSDEPEVILEAEKHLASGQTSLQDALKNEKINNSQTLNQASENTSLPRWSDIESHSQVTNKLSDMDNSLKADDGQGILSHFEKILPNDTPIVDLPRAMQGYFIVVLSKLSGLCINRFSRMTTGPRGLCFACDNSVWLVDNNGQLAEYARIRGNSTISGLRFDKKGMLYISTVQGTVYRIDPCKSGRILAQLDGTLTGGGTFLSDIVLGNRDDIYVSNFPSNTGGIFKIDNKGSVDMFIGGPGHGTQGLLLDRENHLWSLEHGTGSVLKYSSDGRELARINIAEPESFNFSDGFDGNLAMDSLQRLYVTVGKAGMVVRVNQDYETEVFMHDLVNPTGITFGDDGSLYVLESGKARVLRVLFLNKKEKTTQATALS